VTDEAGVGLRPTRGGSMVRVDPSLRTLSCSVEHEGASSYGLRATRGLEVAT